MSGPPKTPLLTVDGLLRDAEGRVLLIRRGHPPFQGSWALPGGFVDIGEDPRDACVREVKEETGLDVEVLELGGFYGRPDRDPRGHTCSAVYRCRVVSGVAAGGDDAAEARWLSLSELEGASIAFDHRSILAELLEEPSLLPS